MVPAPEDRPLTRGLSAVHPGAILRETVLPDLKARGHAKLAVAEQLGVSRQALENLLTEKAAVTPEMALRLGKLCGNGPDLWLNLQKAWDLARAREKLGASLDAIPTLAA